MRRSTFFMGLMTCIIGAGLFHLKYDVMRLESQYQNINHSIRLSEESISILKAEWSHLTNPDRLQKLARHHLAIEPATQKQLISFRRLSPLQKPRPRQFDDVDEDMGEDMSDEYSLQGQEIRITQSEEAELDSFLSGISHKKEP